MQESGLPLDSEAHANSWGESDGKYEDGFGQEKERWGRQSHFDWGRETDMPRIAVRLSTLSASSLGPSGSLLFSLS